MSNTPRTNYAMTRGDVINPDSRIKHLELLCRELERELERAQIEAANAWARVGIEQLKAHD